MLFTPQALLREDTKYTLMLGQGVKSQARTNLAADYQYAFLVKVGKDLVGPDIEIKSRLRRVNM